MVAQIKRVDRSATLSFCPSGPFLAAGSVAGAIDLSFSSATQLEIFRLDFASTDQELRLAGGAVQAPERFSRLCWGPPGVDTKSYPYGLIVGGLCDGSVCLWNPTRIIGHKADAAGSASPASTRGQLLARLQKHQGPVKGLEFNGFSPNLLASGGADGELCIWDVGNPLQPSLYPAMGGSGGPQPEITHLAWNRKVQHILATCTAAGTVVVWDLKKQRPVISFKDPSGRKRCSALQWNPEVATQLMVASDDDMAPSLQLWDLRNSVSPVKEFHGHAKGVLAMSWCPQDSSFILSSGKDNRTICWDVNAGETYCELPPAANWNFDVQWAPGPLAGVFATATFEGQVGISSLSSCTAVGGEADGFSFGQAGVPVASKSKAPAWLKRPVGATLGFGGKLVQLTNSKRQLPTGETATSGSITISQVMTEPEMVQRSEAFEAAIRGGDRDALNAFCQDRESQLAGSEEAETWAFLQTHFAPDGRKYLLERLGFAEYLAAQQQQAEAGADGGAEGGAALEQEGQHTAGDVADGMQQLTLEQQQQQQQQAAAAAHLLGADDGADFFEQSPVNDQAFFDQLVGTPPRNTAAVSPTHRSAPVSPKPPTERGVIDGPPGEREVDIQRLLFVGNYQGAVEACLEAERHADALVVASVVGGELWDTARKAYMLAHPRPYMRMLHSVLSGDWAAFINARHPSAWRETLAAILTSAPYEQFESLLAALAGRLAQAGMAHAATLCFICAGDVDPAVRQWTKAVSKGGQAPTVEALEALMEKAVVLGLGVNRQGASEALSDLIVRYAELLASNGRLGTALEYLSMIPGEPTTGIAVLKERIYRSAAGSSQLPPTVVPPPFPFSAEEVTVSAYQQQGSTGYAQQGGYNMQAQQQQQPASSYQSYGGGYGVAPAQQQNGYGAGTPSGYSSTPAAAPAPPPPQVQQYSPMQQYQAPQAQQYQPPPAQYQAPQAQQYQAPPQQQQYQSYGSAGGYAAPPSPAGTPTGQQQQQQQYQAAVYQPSAAASAPQVFQPSASGPGMGMQAPPPSAAPPPAQVFQPVAAPAAVYQHAPMAASAGGPPATAYQSTSGSMAATAFVPQQGPAAMVPGPRTGPTPTPITAPPPPPPGPPANISLANADTSMVPAHLQPVVASLSNLYRMCEMSAGGHPGKKREVEDSSRKLGVLFWRMGRGEVSDSVAGKLLQLCQALDGGDFVTATHLQVSLTTSDWDECAAWLTALKRLIKARQMVG